MPPIKCEREGSGSGGERTFSLAGIDILMLDIGGVLIRDDLVESMYLWGIFNALRKVQPGLTIGQFFSAREDLMMQGRTDWLSLYALQFLEESQLARAISESWSAVLDNWADLSVPVPKAVETVERLASRTRLGLVANQPREIRQTLRTLDLERYFEVTAVDAELHYSKPDPRIFRWALAQVGVPPHRAMMVGDRVDNDIAGARRVGMRTLWLSAIHAPLPCPHYPASWGAAYDESRKRVGPHNQHTYCSDLRAVAAHYRGVDLFSIAASAAVDDGAGAGSVGPTR